MTAHPARHPELIADGDVVRAWFYGDTEDVARAGYRNWAAAEPVDPVLVSFTQPDPERPWIWEAVLRLGGLLTLGLPADKS